MSELSLLNLIDLLAIVAKFRKDENRVLNIITFFLRNQLGILNPTKYEVKFKIQWHKRAERTNSTYIVSELTQAFKICDELNSELTQKQKVSALILMFAMVENNRSISETEISFIQTVSKLLNISEQDFFLCVSFNLLSLNHDSSADGSMIVFSDHEASLMRDKVIPLPGLNGSVSVLKLSSTDSYFIKYMGEQEITINDIPMRDHVVYEYSFGDVLRLESGNAVHFSDIVSEISSGRSKILMEVDEIFFSFPDGRIGIHELSFSETSGKLVGLMGASGAGKSTLMEVLNGNLKPEMGRVLINGIDVHSEKERIEGVIGHVPQDDLLIEDLTVFQNLYFAAKLAFADKSEEGIVDLVNEVIQDLDLEKIAQYRVGNPLKKIISGGQRKRLNIGLELLRAPSVMFLDEPTSGLSSRDSQNIMTLLKKLSSSGKLIFVVIHQPSPDIFKLFDRLLIVDKGGYPIYYGNPLEAITYFKRKANMLNKEIIYDNGRLNPEVIFDMIEARSVNEFGSYTSDRRTSPEEWYNEFRKRPLAQNHMIDVPELNAIKPAGWLRQFKTFIARDTLAKFNNVQYMLINVLQAPALAIFLAVLNRYYDTSVAGTEYIFSENQNIPVFLFISIIVALFMGLTISAEEIVQDQKILKREQFLNLSRSSYLVSKVVILFTMSIFQTLSFWLISSSILDVPMFSMCHFWLLFSAAAFANMLGLNISSMFNKAITVYILIPILLIPQLVLGGIVLQFDKINPAFKKGQSVPIASEMMVSRWVYEGLMVHFFVDNRYNRNLFETRLSKHQADHHSMYRAPNLEAKIQRAIEFSSSDRAMSNQIERDLRVVKNELRASQIDKFEDLDRIKPGCGEAVLTEALNNVDAIKMYWTNISTQAANREEEIIRQMTKEHGGTAGLTQFRQANHNDAIEKFVRELEAEQRLIELNERLVVLADPIYREPEGGRLFSISHFFSPYKYFFGFRLPTHVFNAIVVWMITCFLYISLYFDLFRQAKDWFGQRIYSELFGSIFDKNEKL